MSLFLVHCGFYDPEAGDGVYESHVNFFVVAPDFEQARQAAKALPAFRARRMHVDGLQRIDAVSGWEVTLRESSALQGETRVVSHRHRDLAPTPVQP
jgi:hypothetical protein